MIYDVALTLIDKIGPKTITSLIELFGSAQSVLCNSYDMLLQMEVAPRIAQLIAQHREEVIAQAQEIINHCTSMQIAILVRNSEHYPKLLAECADAPHVIYVRGYINFNKGKWISIVGTRDASTNGIQQTATIVNEIATSYDDVVIVSGLAFGIDKAAHTAALDCNVRTVAVMPGWVDDITPRSHYALARRILNQNGVIISDMPPKTTITGSNFLSRNRIIAGLSHCTIVVESGVKGGSLVTADITVGYDRELFALPGSIDQTKYQGTNTLIKSSKATLYQDISDLAQTMSWKRASVEPLNPSRLPDYLYDTFVVLPDTEPITLDFISDSLDITVSEASSRMIQLEMSGYVKSIKGRMYQKAKF